MRPRARLWEMKTMTKAVLAGFVFEAALVGLFFLFPFGMYGGSALGKAIVWLHLPFLALFQWVVFAYDLETKVTGPIWGFTGLAFAIGSMWLCWSVLSYAILAWWPVAKRSNFQSPQVVAS